MSDGAQIGQRYSLLYLRPDEALSDSPRFRRRLSKRFDATVESDDHPAFGAHLERELGIAVLSPGSWTDYIHWDDILDWELRDILCAITLVGRYASTKKTHEASQYPAQIARIFTEESANYRLDEKCGVHPGVDTAYQANYVASIRGTEQEAYTAARSFLSKADDNLMPDGDRREAVRAAFDAVENIFKIAFDGAISLNKMTINGHLRPFVERTHTDVVAKRTALKSCEALMDWADACHNYRHAHGEPEPAAPPEELVVVLVSQGFSYVRWLADLRRRYGSA